MHRRTLLKTLWLPVLMAAKPRVVRVDPEGWISIDGNREFIIGLYSLPRIPDAWKEATEAGFNLVHGDIAQARAHNLYAWVSLGSKNAEKIRAAVASYKDDPALLFWETEDEPTFVWKKTEARVPPEDIIATCRMVKAIDPAHPFYLNHSPTNLVSTLRKYNDGADIIATDVYPVIPHGIREQYALWPNGQQGDLLNSTISQVGQYADKMRQVAGPERAVFMVLQAFAWEDLRKQDRDPKMVLYPSRAQLRFMTFQSIVHGANGVIYWGLSTNPPGAPVWADLKAVATELRRMKDALAHPAKIDLRLEYHDTGHSLDRGIEWTARRGREGLFLIAVNADPNPVDVTLSGDFNRRELFAPFDTRVYPLAPGRV